MKFFWVSYECPIRRGQVADWQIFYKTGRIRVAISTANMVPYDWEWIENVSPSVVKFADNQSVFVQDFLPRSGSATPTTPLGDDFLERFRDLLIHMKVHKAIKHLHEEHPFGKRITLDPSEALQDLSNHDFSKVRVKLVMSVPGKYTGFDQMDEYGLCRLGSLLKEEKWVPGLGKKIVGEYQVSFGLMSRIRTDGEGSSLGNYTLEWIDTFYRFMNANEAKDLVGRPKAKEWPSMKVLFPSLATVETSELGKEVSCTPLTQADS
jgi:tyrosyl-DNA phosphodiesterase-1